MNRETRIPKKRGAPRKPDRLRRDAYLTLRCRPALREPTLAALKRLRDEIEAESDPAVERLA